MSLYFAKQQDLQKRIRSLLAETPPVYVEDDDEYIEDSDVSESEYESVQEPINTTQEVIDTHPMEDTVQEDDNETDDDVSTDEKEDDSFQNIKDSDDISIESKDDISIESSESKDDISIESTDDISIESSESKEDIISDGNDEKTFTPSNHPYETLVNFLKQTNDNKLSKFSLSNIHKTHAKEIRGLVKSEFKSNTSKYYTPDMIKEMEQVLYDQYIDLFDYLHAAASVMVIFYKDTTMGLNENLINTKFKSVYNEIIKNKKINVMNILFDGVNMDRVAKDLCIYELNVHINVVSISLLLVLYNKIYKNNIAMAPIKYTFGNLKDIEMYSTRLKDNIRKSVALKCVQCKKTFSDTTIKTVNKNKIVPVCGIECMKKYEISV
jgi:hypothetical protein